MGRLKSLAVKISVRAEIQSGGGAERLWESAPLSHKDGTLVAQLAIRPV